MVSEANQATLLHLRWSSLPQLETVHYCQKQFHLNLDVVKFLDSHVCVYVVNVMKVYYIKYMNLRGRSRKPAASKMVLFTAIVSCCRPVTIAVKIFIIDTDCQKVFIISYKKWWLVRS